MTSRLRSLFLNFALLAFVVRSLIPAGFMPGQGTEGFSPLVICSASGGSSTIYVPASGTPDGTSHAQHKDICVFAAAFATGALPAAPVLALLPAESPARFAATEFSLRGIETKPYLSQGPPVLPV